MKPVSNAFRKEIETKATWIQSESKVDQFAKIISEIGGAAAPETIPQ